MRRAQLDKSAFTGRPLALALPLLLAGCTSALADQPSQSVQNMPADQSSVAKAWQDYLTNSQGTRPFRDFSAAGVHYGEKAIPDTSDWPAISIRDYGAVPDDGRDDTASLRQAIDAAEARGGAAIQFEAGRYALNNDPAQGSVFIEGSNIVLRGDPDGATELFMAKPMPPKNPNQKWSGPAMIVFKPADMGLPHSGSLGADLAASAQIIGAVLAGSVHVPLTDAAAFKAGDYVSFDMESSAANTRFLSGKPTRDSWTRINTRGVMAREKHRIAEVDGNVLVLEQPLLTPLDADLPWRVRPVSMIENVGVENITFTATFLDPFEHHKDARHDSGYRAIDLMHTAHSWVRGSRFRNVSTAVSMRGALASSVVLNVIEGNAGHFSFNSEFGTRNMIGLNIDNSNAGQWHGPGASHMSVGTVVWRYISPRSRGIDVHAIFPRHTLFDQVVMNGFGGWGGNVRNLPNHLGGMVVWNFTQTGPKVGNNYSGALDFWDLPSNAAQDYGFLTAVDPVIAGYKGSIRLVNEANIAHVEALGTHVTPDSLYEAQLERRLGKRPVWLATALAEWKTLQRQVLGSAGKP